MTYVVEPLFAEWARFSDTRLSRTMLGYLALNKAGWSAALQELGGGLDEGTEASAEEPDSTALPQGSQRS